MKKAVVGILAAVLIFALVVPALAQTNDGITLPTTTVTGYIRVVNGDLPRFELIPPVCYKDKPGLFPVPPLVNRYVLIAPSNLYRPVVDAVKMNKKVKVTGAPVIVPGPTGIVNAIVVKNIEAVK
ncbi:MAG: hypothetical protein ACPLTR_00910 [Thermacetogeniaceae bacterium]